MPVEEKKAPHPLAVMDKEAKSPFAGDTWKKVTLYVKLLTRFVVFGIRLGRSSEFAICVMSP